MSNKRRKDFAMEKAFAFICAPEDTSAHQLAKYCRKVIDLGYIPVCPRLEAAHYLDFENTDDGKLYQDMARLRLRRCRMVVLCGQQMTNTMTTDLGMASQYHLICTTLDGLAKIKEAQHRYPC
mgnify:CR=1 FL=1